MPDEPSLDPIRKLLGDLLQVTSDLVFVVNALERDLQATKAATLPATAPTLPQDGPGEE